MMIRILLLLSLSITGCQTAGPPDNRQVSAPDRGTPSPAQNADPSLRKASLVKGPGFVGVIFRANTKAIPELYPAGVSYWTPSESDVFAAEHGHIPFLKNSNNPRVPEIVKRLETYKRQYRGIILGGHKQIVIRFFCETNSDDWTSEETIVLDGGSCFFNLRFSTETKTFSGLEINGFA
jgi:hypothetical protein